MHDYNYVLIREIETFPEYKKINATHLSVFNMLVDN